MTARQALLQHLPARVLGPCLLGRLARVTARGFGTTAPVWRRAPYAERLAAYAEFTAAEGGRLLDDAHADLVTERLHEEATALGSMLRRRLGIRRPQDALEALEFLYRHIGIEMTSHITGDCPAARLAEVKITRCFFAGYYCEPVCRVVSALDAGFVAGLFGGASLYFYRRITDGSPCCRAVLQTAEAPA